MARGEELQFRAGISSLMRRFSGTFFDFIDHTSNELQKLFLREPGLRSWEQWVGCDFRSNAMSSGARTPRPRESGASSQHADEASALLTDSLIAPAWRPGLTKETH